VAISRASNSGPMRKKITQTGHPGRYQNEVKWHFVLKMALFKS